MKASHAVLAGFRVGGFAGSIGILEFDALGSNGRHHGGVLEKVTIGTIGFDQRVHDILD